MESLEFTIFDLYFKSSPIGRFEGLVYLEEKFGRSKVYYPKNKNLIMRKNIGKKIKIVYTENGIIEELF